MTGIDLMIWPKNNWTFNNYKTSIKTRTDHWWWSEIQTDPSETY